MKKLLIASVLTVAMSLCMLSCSGCSSNKNDKKKDTIPTFVKADTAEVLGLATKYLDLVKNQQYDEAEAMLSVIENDSVMQLTDDQKRIIRGQQKAFPVLDYHLVGMEFINENRVHVTYAIEFFKKDPKDSIQNTIRLTFAPQRINAVWYLELLDRSVMK